MSIFLHDAGYIAAIENCAPMVVKRTVFATHVASFAVRRLVQHHIFYTHNVIVIRCLVQHKVVATELYT